MITVTDLAFASAFVRAVDRLADRHRERRLRVAARWAQSSASRVSPVALPISRARATTTGWSVVRSTSRLLSSK
jgi:hypothetical protein